MSYMELCLHLDKEKPLYLRVPTVWDEVKKQWIGYCKTPKTFRLIHGEGKDSFTLQNSFNVAMSNLIHESEEMGEEIFSMFHPRSYWEENE